MKKVLILLCTLFALSIAFNVFSAIPKTIEKPEITSLKNPFPHILFDDGYHNVYFIRDDETYDQEFSGFTPLYTNDYRLYVDLGLVEDRGLILFYQGITEQTYPNHCYEIPLAKGYINTTHFMSFVKDDGTTVLLVPVETNLR